MPRSIRTIVLWLALLGLVLLLAFLSRRRPAPEHAAPVGAAASSPEPDAGASSTESAPPARATEPEGGSERTALASDGAPATAAFVRVVGLPDRSAIAGATVELRRYPPGGRRLFEPALRTCTTDATGRVELGYDELAGATVRVLAADRFPVEVDAPEELSDGAFEVALEPAGSLLVTVLGEGGAPVPDAYVRTSPARGRDGALERRWGSALWPIFSYREEERVDWPLDMLARTDAAGRVRLEPLPCDYPMDVIAARVVPDCSARVVIPHDALSAAVVLHATGFGAIRGRVVTADGSPATGVLIRCVLEDRLQDDRSGGTGEDGGFSLQRLPAGWITWRLDAPGESVRATRVEPGQVTDVGTIRLARTGALELRVLESRPERRALLRTLVLELYRGGSPVGTADLGADGRVSIDVPAGTITYELSTQDELLAEGTLEIPGPPGVLDLEAFAAAVRVELPAGEDPAPLRLHLRDAGPEPRRERSCTLEEVPAAAGGGRALEVYPLAPRTTDAFLVRGTRIQPLGAVTLTAGKTTVLRAIPGAAAALAVHVRTAGGAPLAGVPVHVALLAGGAPLALSQVSATTTEAGVATFDLSAGTWRVSAYPEAIAAHRARDIVLAEGESASVALTGEAGGTVHGSVTYDGAPPDRVSVHLRPRGAALDASGPWHAEGDDSGRFVLEAVPAGDWTAALGLRVRGENTGLERELTVRPGADTTLAIELSAPPLTRVRLLHAGEPLPAVHDVVAVGRDWSVRGWPTEPGGSVVALALREGPCIFLVRTSDARAQEEVWRYPPDERVGYAPAVTPGRAFDLDLDGTRVSVESAGPGAPLPVLVVLAVGSGSARIELSARAPVPFTDADGVRTFAAVPPGSSLRLETPSGWPGDRPALELTVGTEPTMHVSWPPE